MGYSWLWRAEIIKPSFQFYKIGTEAARHEKGKEMKDNLWEAQGIPETMYGFEKSKNVGFFLKKGGFLSLLFQEREILPKPHN